MGSLTAEHRERVPPPPSRIGVSDLGTRTTFSKNIGYILLVPSKLPAMVLTNIAFGHPKLNLNRGMFTPEKNQT